jgi:hypothetical protein
MTDATPVSRAPRNALRRLLLAGITAGAVLALSAVALAMSMKPDVKAFMPMSAAEGATVTITGTDLTGATSVKFGGVAAMHFSVKSGTRVTAVVPKGAKKGTISVTTTGGSSMSMEKFTPKM